MHDLFAKPIFERLNIGGQEKVSTKLGISLSLILHLVLITAIAMSSIQIFSFQRYTKSERTEYGENNEVRLPIRNELANLAFRATDIRRKEGSVDERYAEWKVRLTTSK